MAQRNAYAIDMPCRIPSLGALSVRAGHLARQGLLNAAAAHRAAAQALGAAGHHDAAQRHRATAADVTAAVAEILNGGGRLPGLHHAGNSVPTALPHPASNPFVNGDGICEIALTGDTSSYTSASRERAGIAPLRVFLP